MKSRLAQSLRKPFTRRDVRDNETQHGELLSASNAKISQPDPSARPRSLFSNDDDPTPSVYDRQLDVIITTLDGSIASGSTAPNLGNIYDQLETLQKELQPKWRGSVLSLQSNTMNRLARLDTAVDRFTAVFGQAASQCLEQVLSGDFDSLLQLCRVASHGAESVRHLRATGELSLTKLTRRMQLQQRGKDLRSVEVLVTRL